LLFVPLCVAAPHIMKGHLFCVALLCRPRLEASVCIGLASVRLSVPSFFLILIRRAAHTELDSPGGSTRVLRVLRGRTYLLPPPHVGRGNVFDKLYSPQMVVTIYKYTTEKDLTKKREKRNKKQKQTLLVCWSVFISRINHEVMGGFS